MDTPPHARNRLPLPTGPLAAADQVRLGLRHLHHHQPHHSGVLVGLASFPAIWANVIATSLATVPSFELNRTVGLGARRSAVPPPPSRPVRSPFVRRFGHLHLRGASGLWCHECLDAGGAHRRGRDGQRRRLRSSLGDSVRALRPHPVSFTPGPRRHRRPIRFGAGKRYATTRRRGVVSQPARGPRRPARSKGRERAGVELGRHRPQRGGQRHGAVSVVQRAGAIAEEAAGHGHAPGRDRQRARECTEHGACIADRGDDTVTAQRGARAACLWRRVGALEHPFPFPHQLAAFARTRPTVPPVPRPVDPTREVPLRPTGGRGRGRRGWRMVVATLDHCAGRIARSSGCLRGGRPAPAARRTDRVRRVGSHGVSSFLHGALPQ